MRRTCLAAFIVLLLPGPTWAQTPGGVSAVAFMQGCWRGPLGDSEGDFIEERYGQAVGDMILGTVAYVRGGRVVQHEFVELRATAQGGLSFLPYPGGSRSEHTFHLTSRDDGRVVFEAPEHDYPRRILYRAVGTDGLEGSIDGGPQDTTPRRWPLKRIPCEVGPAPGDHPAPGGHPAAGTPEAADAPGRVDFQRHLAWLTRDGTSWITPNPGGAGGVERYGMHYELARGGMGVTGCLWGETAGQVVGVFWDFFQAWDPVAGKALVYQSGPGGDVGVGVETRRAGREGESVQTFVWSDGSRLTQKHLLVEQGEDTLVTNALNLVDGAWKAASAFTWHRTRTDAPCTPSPPQR
jgi:hypothetical protein